MQRKDFVWQVLLAGFSIAAINPAKPHRTPEEEEGPFATHEPKSLVLQNIVGDRQGIPLSIHLSIFTINKKMTGCKNAMVDIWHCDNKGEYSEYGGADSQRGPGGMHGIPSKGASPKGPFQRGRCQHRRVVLVVECRQPIIAMFISLVVGKSTT